MLWINYVSGFQITFEVGGSSERGLMKNIAHDWPGVELSGLWGFTHQKPLQEEL